MKGKMKALMDKLFHGEVTVKKRELWLIALICLFAGIVYGIKKAPWTHGVTIGSNNGNNSGNCTGTPEEQGTATQGNCGCNE